VAGQGHHRHVQGRLDLHLRLPRRTFEARSGAPLVMVGGETGAGAFTNPAVSRAAIRISRRRGPARGLAREGNMGRRARPPNFYACRASARRAGNGCPRRAGRDVDAPFENSAGTVPGVFAIPGGQQLAVYEARQAGVDPIVDGRFDKTKTNRDRKATPWRVKLFERGEMGADRRLLAAVQGRNQNLGWGPGTTARRRTGSIGRAPATRMRRPGRCEGTSGRPGGCQGRREPGGTSLEHAIFVVGPIGAATGESRRAAPRARWFADNPSANPADGRGPIR